MTQSTAASYLTFDGGIPKGRRTLVLNVRSTSGVLLGRIAWYSRWRQYTFRPAEDTIFNKDCMRELADKCDELTRAHRASTADPGRGSEPSLRVGAATS